MICRQRYLERLAELYPTIAAASTEVINLEAILNLPKGTEHFLTDIHGEYEAFSHVLRNGSGAVRRKVNDVFGNTLSSQDKQTLATLIYYPREKMAQILEHVKNRGGLVQDYPVPPDRGEQAGCQQIHQVQGAKGSAPGVLPM